MKGTPCQVCGLGPDHGIGVFLVKWKGETGIWACVEHIKNTDSEPARIVRQVMEILHRAQQED